MPDPIVCPHCREELDIPAEYHGRQVRCANCQNVFTATPGGDTPVVHRLPGRSERGSDRPPWQDDDRPRRARRADEHDDRPSRRSNAGVWMLMAVTLFTVGGCCTGLNVVAVMSLTPPITPHTSAEGKFKVEFPGENPVGSPLAGEDDAGKGWQVKATRAMANEEYVVKCYDLKAEWRKLSPQEALEKVAKAEAEAMGAGPEMRHEENVKHDGFPAFDLLCGTGNGMTRRETLLRCILAGRRVYVVAARAPNIEVRFWWFQKYFVSFEITDPAAKPQKKED